MQILTFFVNNAYYPSYITTSNSCWMIRAEAFSIACLRIVKFKGIKNSVNDNSEDYATEYNLISFRGGLQFNNKVNWQSALENMKLSMAGSSYPSSDSRKPATSPKR